MLYEPAELCGRPILGTGYPIDHATVPAGIHSYDYLHIRDRCIITSERDSQYAEGTVLLKDPLTFGKDGTLDAGQIDHDKYMDEHMVTPQRIAEFFITHAQVPGSAAQLPEAAQI